MNVLVGTDVYKMGHMEQIAPGCNQVYSYLLARSDKKFKETVFFGLQYILKEYLSAKLTPEMGEKWLEIRRRIIGSDSEEVTTKIRALCKLGYFPVKIKAIPEGTVMSVRNVLMTIKSTNDEFCWVTGYLESLLLKVWYPTTVATCCYQYKKLVDRMFDRTVDEDQYFLKPFMVHDFGYRGDTSEEGAAISGAAHLLSFMGSDTVPALPFIDEFYTGDKSKTYMMSVPATEHAVMCSYGRDGELEAYKNLLRIYPTGLVSIVSDTFNIWTVLRDYAAELKEEILARDGKVVFRGDSGDPESIICGTIDYIKSIESEINRMGTYLSSVDKLIFECKDYIQERSSNIYDPLPIYIHKNVFCKDLNKFINLKLTMEYEYIPIYDSINSKILVKSFTPEYSDYFPTDEEKGCIRLLDEMFGSTVNKKGFKVLNPKVGFLYGDGMYYERSERSLERLETMGYASSEVVIAAGGIFRNHSRDTLGFALKSTHVEVNGIPRDIEKDPITDPGKKSHKGYLKLEFSDGKYVTTDKCSKLEEESGLLQTVFEDGKLLIDQTFDEIKARVQEYDHAK